MDLVFLHGPPAVGKLTVATALAARTGLKLFHNHLVLDAITAVFDFRSPGFLHLREALWLEVFATALEAGDARTRNLYLDVATVAELQKHEQLQQLAARIRQIGPQRILYGSDGAFGGNRTPDEHWGTFRGMVPLTDEEFAVIRDNVAPYLR